MVKKPVVRTQRLERPRKNVRNYHAKCALIFLYDLSIEHKKKVRIEEKMRFFDLFLSLYDQNIDNKKNWVKIKINQIKFFTVLK